MGRRTFLACVMNVLRAKRHADVTGLQIQWGIVLGATLLVAVGSPTPFAWIAIGVAALVTLLVEVRRSFILPGGPCTADCCERGRYVAGAAFCLLSFAPAHRGDNLWLLSLPLVIGEAIETHNRRKTLYLTGFLAAIQTTALAAQGAYGIDYLSAGSAFVLAALAGIVLAGFKARDAMLTAHDSRFRAVTDCSEILAQSGDLHHTIQEVLRRSAKETAADVGYVILTQDDPREFSIVARYPHQDPGLERLPQGLEQAIKVAHTGRSKRLSESGISGIWAPLVARNFSSRSHGEVLGVVALLDTTREGTFKGEDLAYLQTIASLMSVVVASEHAEKRQSNSFLRTLETLALALEARDEYTNGHSQRVCELSTLIARQLRLDEQTIRELRIGTILHDIGKIGVPDDILNKRGRLTDEEFAAMKSHAAKGYEICRPLQLDPIALSVIRSHHERMDGRGYPDGLGADELSLPVRIVCVADAFDAMASKRPYRSPMSIADIIHELESGRGSQFDPVVVDAVLSLITSFEVQSLYAPFFAESEVAA